MSKLYRARSLLYRCQILQENIRWKALDEIYKIYMLLHRSDLNISEKNRQTFSHFRQNLPSFEMMSLNFVQNLTTFCRNFANIFENVELMLKTKQLCLRRSVPIEPKTGNIWPKFCHPTNDLFYVARLGVSATLQLTTSFTWLVLEYLPRSNQRLVLRGSSWSICHGLVLGCIDADFCK